MAVLHYISLEVCVRACVCAYTEVVRNLSVITAVEESNGWDFSVVRRPIEIMSNPRHNRKVS